MSIKKLLFKFFEIKKEVFCCWEPPNPTALRYVKAELVALVPKLGCHSGRRKIIICIYLF